MQNTDGEPHLVLRPCEVITLRENLLWPRAEAAGLLAACFQSAAFTDLKQIISQILMQTTTVLSCFCSIFVFK